MIQLLYCVSGSRLLVYTVWSRSLPAVVAVEVIRVVGVILEQKGLLFNDGVTLLANVLAEATSFLSVVARTTQVPDSSESRDKSNINVMNCNVNTRVFPAFKIAWRPPPADFVPPPASQTN